MTDRPEQPPTPTEAEQISDAVHALQTVVNRVREAVGTDQPCYPYCDGDVAVLGPEVFASADGETISWQGANYRRDHGLEMGGDTNPRNIDAELRAANEQIERLAAERDEARETIRRLNSRCQQTESELATYRRAVAQWDVSERGTYIPHTSLRVIGKACGVDILGSIRHLRHFQRIEQAEAALARVHALADRIGSGNAPWTRDEQGVARRIREAATLPGESGR